MYILSTSGNFGMMVAAEKKDRRPFLSMQSVMDQNICQGEVFTRARGSHHLQLYSWDHGYPYLYAVIRTVDV